MAHINIDAIFARRIMSDRTCREVGITMANDKTGHEVKCHAKLAHKNAALARTSASYNLRSIAPRRNMKRFSILLALCLPTHAGHGKEHCFYVGVYLYEYRLLEAATQQNRDYFQFLEEHLRILHDHHVNAFYLGGSTPERIEAHLKLAKKYGMKVIPQLDFAYFDPAWPEEQLDVYAATAGRFIRPYQDDERILAWSVCEEPAAAATAALGRYYAAIRKHSPRAKFNIIHNNLAAAQNHLEPLPAIFGTDRYAFWFEVSGGGYLASPSFALEWTREQAGLYYEEALKRKSDFMLVVTQGGMLMPQWANHIVADPEKAGIPGTLADQLLVRDRVVRFAREGRMGWQQAGQPPRYNFWKYYRLPANCMKALAWTSVLKGAKLFFCWSYSPPTRRELELSPETVALLRSTPHEYQWTTLAGRPGMQSQQLAELGAAAKEIRAFEGVISRMEKAAQSPIACDQPGIHHAGFSLPGTRGVIAVIHNANVGRWPAESAHFFDEDDDIRIDGEGNLVGYTPHQASTRVAFRLNGVSDSVHKVFDLAGPCAISANPSGEFEVTVGPGSGTLIFVGPEREAEHIRNWMWGDGTSGS